MEGKSDVEMVVWSALCDAGALLLWVSAKSSECS